LLKNRAVAIKIPGDKPGTMLMGKRRDSGKWTLPAGHLEHGEDPRDGVLRELHEETGMRALKLKIRKITETPGGYCLYVFDGKGFGVPRLGLDPDDEFSELDYVNPDEVELHHPRGSNAALD